MALRGLRNKSTRTSSPATFGAREQVSAPDLATRAKEPQRTMLDNWVEPPLRTAAPSFEDNKGLERVGVLEMMQPLGRRPDQKMLQKLKLHPPKSSHRSTPFQNEEVSTPTSEVARMETASPSEPPRRSSSVKAEEVEMKGAQMPGAMRKESEHDYGPTAEAMPPSPARPPPSQTQVLPPPAHFPPPSIPAPTVIPHNINFHVEAAIREAENSNSASIVPGLRNLRNDAYCHPDLWTVLNAVLSSTADRQQQKIFRKYIKAGIAQQSTHSLSPSGQPQTPQGQVNHLGASPERPNLPQPNLPSSTSKTSPNFNSTIATGPIPFHPQPSPSKMASPTTSPSKVESAPAASEKVNGTTHPPPSPAKQKSPARPRRGRSASISSSLSSAKSLPDEEDPFAPNLELAKDAQINGSEVAKSAAQRQGSKRVAGGSNHNTKPRHTLSNTPRDPDSDFNTTSKFAAKHLKRIRGEPEFDKEDFQNQKQAFHDQSFHDYNRQPQPESDERTLLIPRNLRASRLSPAVPPPVVHPDYVNRASASLSSPIEATAPYEHQTRNGVGRKRSRNEQEADEDEQETPLSSSPASGLALPPMGAASSSRADTPRLAKQPPAKRQKKTARVMVSPNKPKNGGVTAGVARAGPGKESAADNDTDDSDEDNNDFCSACGGNGELLCCDGDDCRNSFHFTCLDPPLDARNPPEEQWFCPRCVASQHAAPVEAIGVLGRIVRHNEDSNPKAFCLPFEIRNYFECVKTGDEGEYEEVNPPPSQSRPKPKFRNGEPERPNYKDTRDSKGELITCYKCHRTSDGQRDIIPCDYCPNRWHLDCLDPPLAVPPPTNLKNTSATWRCPLHTENDLATTGQSDGADRGEPIRVPRLRRPRNAIAYDTSLTRGLKNRGLVEVDLMNDADEPRFNNVNIQGKIHRISEAGIRLDFIDRVKRTRYEDLTFPAYLGTAPRAQFARYRPDLPIAPDSTPTPYDRRKLGQGVGSNGSDSVSAPPQASRIPSAEAQTNSHLRAKSFAEQRAVANLTHLARAKDTNRPTSGNSISELTNALITEAPNDVIRLVQRDEEEALLQLQQLVQQRLAIVQSRHENHQLNGNGTAASADGDRGMDDIS